MSGARWVSAAAPQEVRIIGGQWKRTPLAVPDVVGLRPTPSRVRETLFNWLGQDLRGWHCLDAFAGTGALGLEAASRGAAAVTLVEQDGALVRRLEAVCQRLNASAVTVRRGDAVAALRAVPAHSLQLVFLDPPFDAVAVFEPALEAAAGALQANGFVYLEAPRAWEPEALAAVGLQIHRAGKAGMVHFHLLSKLPTA